MHALKLGSTSSIRVPLPFARLIELLMFSSIVYVLYVPSRIRITSFISTITYKLKCWGYNRLRAKLQVTLEWAFFDVRGNYLCGMLEKKNSPTVPWFLNLYFVFSSFFFILFYFQTTGATPSRFLLFYYYFFTIKICLTRVSLLWDEALVPRLSEFCRSSFYLVQRLRIPVFLYVGFYCHYVMVLSRPDWNLKIKKMINTISIIQGDMRPGFQKKIEVIGDYLFMLGPT